VERLERDTVRLYRQKTILLTTLAVRFMERQRGGGGENVKEGLAGAKLGVKAQPASEKYIMVNRGVGGMEKVALLVQTKLNLLTRTLDNKQKNQKAIGKNKKKKKKKKKDIETVSFKGRYSGFVSSHDDDGGKGRLL